MRGGSVGSIGNVRLPQIGPASISSTACSAVTPHSRSPSMIAQSNEDGPRSPGGPGWMMIVRWVRQIRAGTRSRRNGQMIRSGWWSVTAAHIASASPASWTRTG